MTGSFVIDLYHINAVILNQEDMSVVVEGGAYLEEIDKALQPFHLGCPVGTYFMGVGGLVLGDGSGWMSRLFGLSVNNLLECEAVLHDVCSASRVAANFDKNFQNLPPSITPMMVLPGGAPVVVNGIACFGDQTEALPSSLDKAVLIIFGISGAAALDNGDTCVGPQVRSARYLCVMECYWKPEASEQGKAAARHWVKTVTTVLQPYCGENLRYAAANETEDVLRKDHAGYSSDTMVQLSKLKKKYDPDNFVRNNINVKPGE